MNFFGFLAPVLGIVMEWIYRFIPNYGWTIIIFTLVTKVIMFPLQLKQQKSTVRMSAFQPMMQEIQEKYKDDKERMNEELMKFQQESGFSMTAGCLPMALNMLVIFGLIEVVYRPMQYVLRVSKDVITQCVEVANAAGASLQANSVYVQNQLINVIKANPSDYAQLLGDKLAEVQNFQFTFLGIDLSLTPKEAGFLSLAIIIPVLSVLTMIAFQIYTMKASGQKMQGSMMLMTWGMSIMFAFFAFTVPVGFSLYYTASNVFGWVQTIILKKMFDPEKVKEEIQQEMEEKRKAKKAKKEVVIKAADGTAVKKAVNQAEYDRLRLEAARKLDEEMYKDE